MEVLTLPVCTIFPISLPARLAFAFMSLAGRRVMLTASRKRARGRIVSLASTILAYLTTYLLFSSECTSAPSEHMLSPTTVMA